MPLGLLSAAFDDHASTLAADHDQAAQAAAASSAWPLPTPGGLRRFPTSLKATEQEEADRSLMQINKVGPPEKAKLDDLATACKFDGFGDVFGTPNDGSGATRSAKPLGKGVASAADCAVSTSDVVLSDMFGTKLKGTGAGVELEKTHDLPLGSLAKKEVRAARAACEDFGAFLMRRMEKPGEKAGDRKFTQQDATHALKSYGLCVDAVGETAALNGCEMGKLQSMGSAQSAHICQEVEGPMAPGIVCSIM